MVFRESDKPFVLYLLYWQLDPKKSESEEELAKICKERGCSYMVCANPPMNFSNFLNLLLHFPFLMYDVLTRLWLLSEGSY
jgi:hypothetical protein